MATPSVPIIGWDCPIGRTGLAQTRSERPAAAEPGLRRMPPGHALLAETPAQEGLLPLDPAREVDQARLGIPEKDPPIPEPLDLPTKRGQRLPVRLARLPASVRGGRPPNPFAPGQHHLTGLLDPP